MAIKVLIIDNDPIMAELYGLILMLYDLKVVVVTDSQAGIRLARSESPDIILLDFLMPEKNGMEICAEIRAFSQVPIAMISVVDDYASIAAALDAGADDYMVKPIPSGELLARLNSLARRTIVERDENRPLMLQTNPLNRYYESIS
jgi:two-component system, OmpR family, response regulator MtrA